MSRFRALLLPSLAFCLASPAAEAQDRSELIRILQQQVRSCYVLPANARGAEPILVELRLQPNGALMGKPEVIRGVPHSLTAEAALRAVDKCAPFKIPKEFTSLYRAWRVIRIRFDTL